MERRTIQNFEALAENELRLDALSLALAGYAAIDTAAALVREVRIEDDMLHIGEQVHELGNRRVFFVGIGKCAIAGARAIEQILGDRLTAGIALDVSEDTTRPLSKVETFVGTHPLPTEVNEQATKRIVELLSECTKDDLVLMLISGGGSTLLCLHQAPMTCLDESSLFTELSARGAKIQEINTVRKHTSLVRGGGLAKASYPAEVVSLIISDVPGNDIGFISSGPTVLDTSTVADAQAVLDRYELTTPVTFVETPKDAKYFERVTNTLFLTNQHALRAMQEEATRRSYAATIMTDTMTGEARSLGCDIATALHTLPSKTVLLYGGESTVTLGTHPGIGGRNQEMALSALREVGEGELVLPLASDGRDNSDHAGAIADTLTAEHAHAHKLSVGEYLDDHRSYDFFKATGDALLVGYTESNVSDFIIAIKN